LTKPAILGTTESSSFDSTFEEAVKVFFELYAVAPLFVVNILDLDKHKSDNKKTAQGLEIKNGKVLVKNHKIITDTLVVKDNSTSSEISDARYLWTDEGLEIYATAPNNNKIDIEYHEVDLTKVKNLLCIKKRSWYPWEIGLRPD